MESRLRFTYQEKEYKIKFYHSVFGETVRRKPTNVRYTDCRIYEIEGGLVALGSARCSPLDNFSKEKGRKLSLKDALSESNSYISQTKDKEFRRLVWNAYFGR